jgi:hypothetical protein
MHYANRELHNAAPRLPIRIPGHSEKFKFAVSQTCVHASNYCSPVRATITIRRDDFDIRAFEYRRPSNDRARR